MRPSRTLRRGLIGLGITAVVVVASGLLALRYLDSLPVGTGETRVSPDGRFTASVYDFHRKQFFGGESESWFDFSVTGPDVAFAMKSTPLPAPYFGSRSSHSVIRWEADSSAVTFVFSNSQLRVETNRIP